MARIKRGTTKHRRHHEVLKHAKGYQMTYHRLYKRAKEALLHAGQYSFAHRRHRRGQMRGNWIKILSAALSGHGISYSKFIGQMANKNIVLDRKVIAQIAIEQPTEFKQFVDSVNS